MEGRTKTPADWSGVVRRTRSVFMKYGITDDITLTELDTELGELARQVATKQGGLLAGNRAESAVHLTTWLLSQMPPEQTVAFGVELAGVLGDKSLEVPETAVRVVGLVNKYDLLDHITPTELQAVLVSGSTKLVFESSYDSFRAAGLPAVQAFTQATVAASAAGVTVYTVTRPVVVALDIQRGADNLVDLGDIGTKNKGE
ncbi:hypothetical protein HTZ77_09410 [Nonomuraea sp. SMC257]|uniref:Uncharacterized protein n=1 Tax=Nonomuraea montanisoli TaxID=2741721 RepID=A0A7Y6I5Q3_9ACTN|nr:hypothetical protein [Nonomuraea montanisoli]NUW31643.1 hypothetical protein [Nonomuraea montanisoli]